MPDNVTNNSTAEGRGVFFVLSQSNLARRAPIVLRLGLAALFLWFGVSQVLSPESWMAWVPEWTNDVLGVSVPHIVLMNGTFEVVGGVLLALGLWTRWVALALSLHLFFIAFEVGYNDIGVRDFTLAVSTLAVSFFGPDTCSLDNKIARK